MSDYFENTDWKQHRLGRFTASEIYLLFVKGKAKDKYFGESAETYIRKKVAEEITQEVKEEIDSRATEWGYSHELEALQSFEKATGLNGEIYGIGNPKFFEYGEHAGGSPDWEIVSKVGADIKCPYNSDVHLENLFIRDVKTFEKRRWEYYCQAQMNMLIRNWGSFYFVSYDPRMPLDLRLAVLEIFPNEDWRKEFKERLEKAIEKKNQLLEDLIARPSILLAHREDNVTIIQSA